MVDLNPKSKGKITVAHSDPEAYPSIDFNPLDNPDDLNFIVDQYIQTFNIMMKARELDPNGIYKVVYPPENIFNLPNEEENELGWLIMLRPLTQILLIMAGNVEWEKY